MQIQGGSISTTNGAVSQQDVISQSAVSQGGFSSKSPNSKQFQAHEQHLSHLFDTLK